MALNTTLDMYGAMAEFTKESEGHDDITDEIDKEHVMDILVLLMYLFLLCCVVLTKWLLTVKKVSFVHESGLALLYGLIVGGILHVSISEQDLLDKATFNPELFFNFLLPIIIFNAGYNTNHKSFFHNFGAIITYAMLGTIISTFVVGGITYFSSRYFLETMSFKDCCIFGAIISATDPVTVLAIFSELHVDPLMDSLVFGESVLNDGTAIVMSKTIEDYDDTEGFNAMAILKAVGNFVKVFGCAFAIGSLMAICTSLVTKFTRIREHPEIETSLFVLMSMATFLAAEAAQLSGIVAIFFCGIGQAHYTYHNLSEQSRQWIKHVFDLLNFLMEYFIFTYIGLSAFIFMEHAWNIYFILSAFVAIFIARASNIYFLSFFLNLGRTHKISCKHQHMLMFSGLRGAIAFALAIRNTSTESRQIIFSTTVVIVIVTVIFCGSLAAPMLKLLKIRTGVNQEAPEDDIKEGAEVMNNNNNNENPSEPPPAPEENDEHEQPDEQPRRNSYYPQPSLLVIGWLKVDHKYLMPTLTHATPALTELSSKRMMRLARFVSSKQQLSEGSESTQCDSGIEEQNHHIHLESIHTYM